jgi:hypothetical protein
MQASVRLSRIEKQETAARQRRPPNGGHEYAEQISCCPAGSAHEGREAPRLGKYLFVSAPFSIAKRHITTNSLWAGTGHPMFKEAGVL